MGWWDFSFPVRGLDPRSTTLSGGYLAGNLGVPHVAFLSIRSILLMCRSR